MIEVPDENRKGKWSEKYQVKIDGAKEAIKRYDLIKERIEKVKQNMRRNHYSLRVMEQINELQIYSARLLLLLGEFDKATAESDKQLARETLKKYVNHFPEVRKRFEDVYSEAREYLIIPPTILWIKINANIWRTEQKIMTGCLSMSWQ